MVGSNRIIRCCPSFASAGWRGWIGCLAQLAERTRGSLGLASAPLRLPGWTSSSRQLERNDNSHDPQHYTILQHNTMSVSILDILRDCCSQANHPTVCTPQPAANAAVPVCISENVRCAHKDLRGMIASTRMSEFASSGALQSTLAIWSQSTHI